MNSEKPETYTNRPGGFLIRDDGVSSIDIQDARQPVWIEHNVSERTFMHHLEETERILDDHALQMLEHRNVINQLQNQQKDYKRKMYFIIGLVILSYVITTMVFIYG